MTGLSLENDALVEIAVLVTDADLNVLGDGVDVVISTTPEKLTAMRDEVRVMHTESGLLEKIPQGVSLSEAEELVLHYLQAHTAAGKSPLAGTQLAWIEISSPAICHDSMNICIIGPLMFHRSKNLRAAGIPKFILMPLRKLEIIAH